MKNSHRKKVAVIGASGHIGKNIVFYLADKYDLLLYVRKPEALVPFLDQWNLSDKVYLNRLDAFGQAHYDAVINCSGLGDPKILLHEPTQIFSITEQIDGQILTDLKNRSSSVYINMSSGAAYCNDFQEPAKTDTLACLQANRITMHDYYGVTKLYFESKHRSLEKMNIVDLRVFGFYSRFINLESTFLLTDIITCIRNKKVFETTNIDIVRDYISPLDFCRLIEMFISKQTINGAFDIYSLEPVKKSEIIRFFENHYGLVTELKPTNNGMSPTGMKEHYYSVNKTATNLLGYIPEYTSMQTIEYETKHLIEDVRGV